MTELTEAICIFFITKHKDLRAKFNMSMAFLVYRNILWKVMSFLFMAVFVIISLAWLDLNTFESINMILSLINSKKCLDILGVFILFSILTLCF